jgi:hypothetical protein
MEVHLMNADTRQNPIVVKAISKLSDQYRQINILRKELEDHERMTENLADVIEQKEAVLTNTLYTTGLLIADLAQNNDNLDIETISIEGEDHAAARTTIAETARYLRWIYCTDPLDVPDETYRAEVIARTPEMD